VLPKFWTGSQCVLQWLKAKKPLSLFVENWVREILKERDIIFQYIVSNENPADLAIRGSTALEISKCFVVVE